jgi:hypothetical protein
MLHGISLVGGRWNGPDICDFNVEVRATSLRVYRTAWGEWARTNPPISQFLIGVGLREFEDGARWALSGNTGDANYPDWDILDPAAIPLAGNEVAEKIEHLALPFLDRINSFEAFASALEQQKKIRGYGGQIDINLGVTYAALGRIDDAKAAMPREYPVPEWRERTRQAARRMGFELD